MSHEPEGFSGRSESAPRRIVLNTALTSVAQAASMITGGVLAILVAIRVGSNAQTDGFFLAYAVYAIVVLIAQSSRTAIVPRLVDPVSRFRPFDQYLGAAIVVFAACGVVFVALGDPVASLLAGSLPDAAADTARSALLVLWPATGGQLFAALAAAMLGVFGNYTTAAASYVTGGAISIVGFIALEPSIGIDALPVAILIGTAVTVAPLLIALVAAGWRPAVSVVSDFGQNAGRAGLVIVSSAALMVTQVLYLVSITVASRLGTGDVTVFSYSFFAVSLVIALLASSVGIVLAAPVAATWDRKPGSLRPQIDDVFRTGLAVLVPAVAAAALVGDDLGDLLLSGFTHAEVERTVTTFLVLTPAAVAAQLAAVPLVALFAQGRYRPLALLSAAIVAFHAGFSVAAAAVDGLAALAAVASLTSLLFAACLVALLFGDATVDLLGRAARDFASVLLPGAVCFGVAAVPLLAVTSPWADACAFAVGLALYAGCVAALMPAQRALAARIIESVSASVARGRA